MQACCADIPANKGYDGNPLFFPLDTAKGILTEARSEGKVPSQYGWNGWPWEHTVAASMTPPVTTPIATATSAFPSTTHNYSFTTEVKYWFKYSATMKATLDFTGDDGIPQAPEEAMGIVVGEAVARAQAGRRRAAPAPRRSPPAARVEARRCWPADARDPWPGSA